MKKIRVLAVICALLTALSVYLFLDNQKKPVIIKKTSVLVAASEIAPYTAVTAEMITLAQIPSEAVIPGAISDSAQIIGKVSRSAIYEGEQLLEEKFVAAGGDSGAKTLAYAIEPGMRAMTISVSETSGLANMIKPGNRIDIIGQFMLEEDSEYVEGAEETADNEQTEGAGKIQRVSAAVMVFENVRILAVDNVLSELGKSEAYTTVTLELAPVQALELSEVMYEGELRVIMRSPVDSEEIGQSVVMIDDIIKPLEQSDEN